MIRPLILAVVIALSAVPAQTASAPTPEKAGWGMKRIVIPGHVFTGPNGEVKV